MQKVRFVFLDTELADQYRSVNREVLLKQRPCLFMAKLRYRGKFQDFAIPLRSNVNPNSLAQGYFYELPPRVSTQLNKVHALDFRKMMPVERRFTRPFQFYNQEDRLSTLVPIQKNINQIMNECQNYLDEYERVQGKILYSTNIDLLLSILQKQDVEFV